MKQTKRKTPVAKRLTLLAVAAVLLVGAVVAGFFLFKPNKKQSANTENTNSSQRDQNPENDVNYDPPTEEEKAESDKRKEEIIKEQDNGTVNPSLAVSITRATQSDQNQPLNIRTLVSGTSTGTCNVTLTKGSHTVTRSFPVVFEATYSTCENANIESSAFPEEGTWKLTVSVAKDSQSSAQAMSNVTIDK